MSAPRSTRLARLPVAGVVSPAGWSHDPPARSGPAPSAAPLPAAAAQRAAPASPTAAIAFCAYGGTGVLPSNVDPDTMYRVLAWLSVRAAEPTSGVTLRAVEVTGEAGVEATLRRVEGIERLDPAAPLEKPGAWQSRGAPFDGALAPGGTKLRVEAWLTHRPKSRPATLRLALGNDAVSVTASCPLIDEWPTG